MEREEKMESDLSNLQKAEEALNKFVESPVQNGTQIGTVMKKKNITKLSEGGNR